MYGVGRSGGKFHGGPVVKTPCFQCRGHGFWSLVRELRSYMLQSDEKIKNSVQGRKPQ